jgi:4-hydroxy-3-methylbut-2-enyl diphosphate reductase
VVDAVVVIGGHESANTRRLVAVAQETGIPVWLVEGIHELPAEIVQYATIGISAGASTPDEVIGEIEKALACRGSSRALR